MFEPYTLGGVTIALIMVSYYAYCSYVKPSIERRRRAIIQDDEFIAYPIFKDSTATPNTIVSARHLIASWYNVHPTLIAPTMTLTDMSQIAHPFEDTLDVELMCEKIDALGDNGERILGGTIAEIIIYLCNHRLV